MLNPGQVATLDSIILEQTGTPPRVALGPGTMLAGDLGLCPFDDHAEIMHEVEQQFGVEIPLVFGIDVSVGGLRDMVAAELAKVKSTPDAGTGVEPHADQSTSYAG